MNLSLTQFLEFATYNRLLNYVHVSNEIAAEIVKEDSEHKYCFVEAHNHETSCVWYPIESWIEECRRRKELNRKVSITIAPEVKTVKQLQNELMQAAMKGDRELIKQLAEKLECIQNTKLG